jgi:hypothetical protein
MGIQDLIKYYSKTWRKMNQDSDLPMEWHCHNGSMWGGGGGGEGRGSPAARRGGRGAGAQGTRAAAAPPAA